MQAKTFPATAEDDSPESEGADSNHLSGSVSSFLANEKLMSFESANSDLTGTLPPFEGRQPLVCPALCLCES